MKPSAALPLVLLATFLLGGGARAQSSPLFLRHAPPAGAYGAQGPGAAWVTLDRDALLRFRASSGGALDVPLADGSGLTLDLERFEVLAPGAVVTATGDRGTVVLHPDVVLFRGRVRGEPGALAVISIARDQVLGVVEHAGGRLVISPASPTGAEHVIGPDLDQSARERAFQCPVETLTRSGPEPAAGLAPLPADVQATLTRLVCDVALDCDYEFFHDKEGADTLRAANYALTLLGTSSAIYERDINVQLRCSYLNIWTTSNDPYTNQSSDGLNVALTDFTDWWNANRTGVSRNIAQLVSGKGYGGGIAWLNTLCNPTLGYSVISDLNGNYAYPRSGWTWDVGVMAHEMGHSFSSMHTHSCWWQSHGYAPAGSLLDSCYAVEGTCYSGPVGIVPFLKGTIMSYCHIPGGANGIKLEFHPACRSVMRAASEAACFAAAAVQPPRGVAASPGLTGTSLTWTASPTSGVLRYSVYRSALPLDLAPAILTSTTGLAFTDATLGTYYYKVRAVRAADSSAFSAEVAGSACSPGTAVAFGCGPQPLAVVVADFDEDGISDLATANFTGGNVSVLRGLGAGGVGNGTFAAPVSVALPAGAFPSALVAQDFNADGILDLAALSEEGGTISILYGNGAGGVGDGTFTLGPSYATATGAWGMATGDFNGDGVPDLAVVTAGGFLYVRLGNVANGLADGTFGAASSYPCGSGGRGIVTGDFNSDGITDLAVACGSGAGVLLGNGANGKGDGTFGAPTFTTCQSLPTALATGDFNADGITDLAVANSSSGSVSILLGHGVAGIGDGTFAAAANFPSGANPYNVAVGDWNGDGVPDLAVPNGGTTNTYSILVGRTTGGVANGTFNAPQAYAGGTQERWIAAGDFDGAGAPDLVIANSTNPGQVSVVLSPCGTSLPLGLTLGYPRGGEIWITDSLRTVTWSKGAGVISADVALSRDGGLNWLTLATGVTDTSLAWNPAGPYTTHARIRVSDTHRPFSFARSDSDFTILPAALLDATTPTVPLLALHGVRPNPARESARVWLSLADGRAATLDLMDLAGRRVRTIALSGLGPGLHTVGLGGVSDLPPGLYLVRLTQGGRAAAAKLVVTH